MRVVTVSEFARERGVSRTRVYQWIEDGRVKKLEGGGVDADAAHAALGQMLDQSKGIRRDGNVTSQGPAPAPAPAPAAAAPGDPQAQGESAAVQTSARAAGGEDLLGGQEGEQRAAPAERGGDRPARPEGAGRDDTGYWESKARREAAEAQLAEMRALQAAGALVPAAGVKKETAELARATRNAMLAIPDQAAAVLNPADPAKCHKLLTDLISRALRDLNERLEQRAAADPGAAEPERALQ